jgi:sodium-dependent dicarboxylate transporter 2/3/5
LAIEEKISSGEAVFERWRNTVGLFLGPLVFLTILLIPFTDLAGPAHCLLAIVSLVIIFWITEALPIPVTALLGAALCIILGVEEEKKVLSSFANPIIFLFMGSFMIARAMRLHRLDQRFAYFILSRKTLIKSYWGIVIAMATACAFVSMWISNTATAAMAFPIALGIVNSLSESIPEKTNISAFRISLLLMVAYASSIGGIATPVGTPPNLIGLGMIESILGKSISFFGWMMLALPLTAVTLLILLLLFKLMFRMEKQDLSGLNDQIRIKRKNLGQWSRGEKNTLVAFLTAVTLWVLPGMVALGSGTSSKFYQLYNSRIPEAVAALIAASLLFILPVNWKKREFTLDWKEAVKIDWGTILLFGGGLTLGSLMFSTGLAEKIGQWILLLTGASSLWTITLISIATAVLISETTSNTASASMVVPVMIGVAQSAGVSPLPPALGATLGASFGFMLPVSTPPNAIVYSSGFIPITKMIRAGLILDLIGIAVIWLGLRLLAPLLRLA